MTPSNKCHTQAVTRRPSSGLEHHVEASIMLTPTQIRSRALSSQEDLSQVLLQCWRNRDGKSLPRVARLPLRVSEPDDANAKVHILPRQLGLTKSATQVGADLKHGQHPRTDLGRGKCRSCFFKISRGEVLLQLCRSTWDLCQGNGILLNEVTPHGFLQDEAKELQLEASRIMTRPTLHSPIHKVTRVLISDMPRMANPPQPPPLQDPHPRSLVSLPTRRTFIMSPDVIHRPSRKVAPSIRRHLGLNGTRLFGHSLSCASLFRVIRPAPRRSGPPLPRLQIAIPQIPVNRLRRTCDVSHTHRDSHKLPHDSSFLKWDKVLSCCKSTNLFLNYSLPLHHKASYHLDFVALAGDSHTAPTNFFEIADVQRGSLCTGRAS